MTEWLGQLQGNSSAMSVVSADPPSVRPLNFGVLTPMGLHRTSLVGDELVTNERAESKSK